MMDTTQEKNWAIACHISSLAWIALALIGVGAIPCLNILAPAVIWYFKKGDSKLIDDHGKESVNFQISMSIYGVVFSIVFVLLIGVLVFLLVLIGATEGNFLTVIFGVVTGLGLIIGLCAVVAIAIFQIIVVVIAATKAKDGQMYRYPFNLRLL